MALINGQAYDYTQIIINILGTPVPSVSAIDYETSQTKENNYGTGEEPVSRGKGVKEYSGSIEISMNDIEALRTVAPDGDLTNIPAFDILVIYGNPQNPVTHRLLMCEFTTDRGGGSQGDTDIKISNDLIIGQIKRS